MPTILEELKRRVGLMSSAEVCQHLGCHENTLYKRVRLGHIPAVKDGGKLKFDPHEVARYICRRIVSRFEESVACRSSCSSHVSQHRPSQRGRR